MGSAPSRVGRPADFSTERVQHIPLRTVLLVGVVTLYAGALKIYLSRLNRTMGRTCHSK